MKDDYIDCIRTVVTLSKLLEEGLKTGRHQPYTLESIIFWAEKAQELTNENRKAQDSTNSNEGGEDIIPEQN